jgi:serine phosphatase RsbU (regulator of sigma subunit)
MSQVSAGSIHLMSEIQVKSAAFQTAALQSERLRIIGILSFVCVFVIVAAVRVFVIRTATPGTRWEWSLLLAAIVAAYESWTLWKVHRVLQAQRHLPARFWIVSTILEASIPAFAIAFLTNAEIETSYRPLASPAVLVFFVFIILSTLRLSPWISSLTGVVAALSYIASATYLGWRPPLPGTPALVTQSGVSLNAITLLAGGLVAGAVAAQIRKHVEAALREAETRSKLEAVQRDLQVARSIQQSLLPHENPQLPGFDIAGWNKPADDTGGDYYDWKTLADGKVVVTLADVTGHGIGSALLAAVCHAYARSSFGGTPDLPTALERIHRDLRPDLSSGRFVTFVAASCCPECPQVEVLSAGHGPLLIYSRREDRFTEMNAHALPLGILPSFDCEAPANLQLQPGDLILLSTDGFFEWENDQGEQFGIPRMEEIVRASREFSASEIITRLYDAVIQFSNGNKQQDDLTAVLIKYKLNSVN